jgi:hypothetical protein
MAAGTIDYDEITGLEVLNPRGIERHHPTGFVPGLL